jgi:hypothetical protein
MQSILKSAAAEPSIKRFVLTSSSTACTRVIHNKEMTIDTNMWNNDDVERAWAPPPYEPERYMTVYGASKTVQEQAFWKFVKEQKPAFVANAVLPDVNFGKVLDGKVTSSAGLIKALYDGDVAGATWVLPRRLCLLRRASPSTDTGSQDGSSTSRTPEDSTWPP